MLVAPAAAIETTTFGLDVVTPSTDGRLHIATRAGETSTGRLRLFNKTDAPLAITLSVSPATVAADGQASLGGDAEPVSWIELPDSPVTVAPGATRILDVRVNAPDRLSPERRAVAIVAEPALSPAGEAPAVLQRVAMTTFLEPDEKSLIASLGAYPWLALALLLVVALFLIAVARKRRSSESAVIPPG